MKNFIALVSIHGNSDVVLDLPVEPDTYEDGQFEGREVIGEYETLDEAKQAIQDYRYGDE